jgi:spore coat protein U-like protein
MNSIQLSRVSHALILASVVGVGTTLLAATPAHAGNATSNLAVTASIAANCTISTSAVAFGAYDPVVVNAAAALNGNGSVTVACTKGSAPTITLDLGLNAAASQRNMKITGGGADLLPYQLFQPPGTAPNTACTFPGSTVWGTTVGQIFTPTVPASKAARTYNVCGTVTAGQDVSVGSYADTVVATVNF